MQIVFFSALIMVTAAVLFAVQNNFLVTVRFLIWSFSWPFAGLLIAALCLGAAASLLVSVPSRLKKRKACAEKEAAVRELEQKLKEIQDQASLQSKKQ